TGREQGPRIFPVRLHQFRASFRRQSTRASAKAQQWRGFLALEKVRPALGGGPAAANPVWGRGGWGRDRAANSCGCFHCPRDAAVVTAGRGSPMETHWFGSDCD